MGETQNLYYSHASHQLNRDQLDLPYRSASPSSNPFHVALNPLSCGFMYSALSNVFLLLFHVEWQLNYWIQNLELLTDIASLYDYKLLK